MVQLLLMWCVFVSWHDGETARIVRMTTTEHYFMVDSGDDVQDCEHKAYNYRLECNDDNTCMR